MKEIEMTGTTEIIDLRNVPLPVTITLMSNIPSRSLEISPIDFENYFPPVLDATTDSMLVLSINTPVVSVRVTGDVRDDIYIRS